VFDIIFDFTNKVFFLLLFFLIDWIMILMLSVRATGHKAPGESSVNITVSSYDTTHLQENPQRLG